LVAVVTVDPICAEQALERSIREEAAQPSPGQVVGVVGVDGSPRVARVELGES